MAIKDEDYAGVAREVIESPMQEYVEMQYLPFAWSVCLDRALLFSTDGLKPIQRRILFTAHRHHVTDKSPLVKSATFEGKVLEFSPHGGCYPTMVNIARPQVPGQPRALRVPLIEGKGNWGGISGGYAASRYTEMRLTSAAMELLAELNEDAVDMVPNYNDTCDEPKFLPARWPVGVINGASDGMAVGFACNIPCHNPDEVMDACIALMKDEKVDIKEFVNGPDFDCGCDIICEYAVGDDKPSDGVKSYLDSGVGSFTMRGKYSVEERKGGSFKIIFDKLPYKISPEKVIEVVKDRYQKGDFKELVSWKDLSDMETPVCLEFITKKGVSIDKVIGDLLKLTPLECSFAVNNTIIVDGMPAQVSIKDSLLSFLNFRRECTKRKLDFRIGKLERQLELAEALAAVLVDIDKCIKIIRNADDAGVACKKLMSAFKINKSQAEYILSLQLRKLTKSDRIEIKKNVDRLRKEIKNYKSILASKTKFTNFICKELDSTKEVISSPRKCKIIKNDNVSLEADTVYIRVNGTRIKRSFKKIKDSYKVADDGRVLIITYKNGGALRSVYELPDNKMVNINKFTDIPGKAITACPAEGFLLLVGINGVMKVVDLSSVDYPKGNTIRKIHGENIKAAIHVGSIKDQTVVINDKKKIPLKDIPVYGISANGVKGLFNKPVDTVELI